MDSYGQSNGAYVPDNIAYPAEGGSSPMAHVPQQGGVSTTVLDDDDDMDMAGPSYRRTPTRDLPLSWGVR